jgi:hypothetical protein
MVLLSLAAVACGDDGDGDGDASADTGGNEDTGNPGDATGEDTEVPPPGEQLHVVYTRRETTNLPDIPDRTQLMVTNEECRASNPDLCDPGSCDAPVEIEPRTESEPLCETTCLVTPALDYVVFIDSESATTLRYAPIGGDFQLTSDSAVITTGLVDFRVGGNIVAYRDDLAVRIFNLEDGTDTEVGDLGASGGFYISDDGSQLFLNRVTSLTAMQISQYDVASGSENVLYQFIAGEEQGTGSFFSGREPMALSPDGTHLAVLTAGRTSSNLCAEDTDCSGGYSCLTNAVPARCVRQELVLSVINLEQVDLLGGPCTSDNDCGAGHECDMSAPTEEGDGECMAAQTFLGPSGPQACAQLTSGQYARWRDGFAWRNNNEVMALLFHECSGQNIPVTDVVAINWTNDAIDRVIENPGQPHGGCVDSVEQCYDTDRCNIEISQLAVSPSGGTIALIADSYTSTAKNELWMADAYGRLGKEPMTRSIDFEIGSVQLIER